MAGGFPSRFRANGNRIVDADGNVTILHGLNVVDPVLHASGQDPSLPAWGSGYYAAAADWGADVVRVPLGPVEWRRAGPQRLAVLDRTLDWIAALGMYAILDFHGIGFPPTGHYEDLGYGPDAHATDVDAMREFWDALSARYAGNDAVAFYELFNEPCAEGHTGRKADWLKWRALCEATIDIIRANDDHTPIIVGGLDFAHDLSFVPACPVERENIVYATHVYPQRRRGWRKRFGKTAGMYPVFCTEWGFVVDPDHFHASYALETIYGPEGHYRRDLLDYLEQRGISWMAWCFAVDWGPGLLAGPDCTPNAAGAFVREQLLSHRAGRP